MSTDLSGPRNFALKRFGITGMELNCLETSAVSPKHPQSGRFCDTAEALVNVN